MDPKHAVLLAIEAEDSGRLVGRTLLQKKLFFASRLLGADMGYRPHYYGPYSQTIADATDADVVNRFIDEQVEVFPDSNVFGERRRHLYTITNDGQQLLSSLKDDPEAKEWRSAFQQINDYEIASDFNRLSIAAKVLAILGDIHEGTAADISAQAAKYGWKLSEAKVKEVRDFLRGLGLTVKKERRKGT